MSKKESLNPLAKQFRQGTLATLGLITFGLGLDATPATASTPSTTVQVPTPKFETPGFIIYNKEGAQDSRDAMFDAFANKLNSFISNEANNGLGAYSWDSKNPLHKGFDNQTLYGATEDNLSRVKFVGVEFRPLSNTVENNEVLGYVVGYNTKELAKSIGTPTGWYAQWSVYKDGKEETKTNIVISNSQELETALKPIKQLQSHLIKEVPLVQRLEETENWYLNPDSAYSVPLTNFILTDEVTV